MNCIFITFLIIFCIQYLTPAVKISCSCIHDLQIQHIQPEFEGWYPKCFFGWREAMKCTIRSEVHITAFSESSGLIDRTWHNPVGYQIGLSPILRWKLREGSLAKPGHSNAFVMRWCLSDDLKLGVTFVFKSRLVSSRCHIRKKIDLDFSAFDYDITIYLHIQFIEKI